ncbi:Calpain-5 [Chelonia mydas]|uniref:Calpain-5 n=1 Tax=Chelonia mydas TaxID=8469 RepID=M7BK65_CHEMY|nr:Calpain-5 [Chelonia mydas]
MGADPYVIIKCEGNKIRSPVQKNTLAPEFDVKGLFYRKKAGQPIIVQVWNHNIISDEFLGQVALTGDPDDRLSQQTLHLQDKGNKKSSGISGSIAVRLLSSSKLTNV